MARQDCRLPPPIESAVAVAFLQLALGTKLVLVGPVVSNKYYFEVTPRPKKAQSEGPRAFVDRPAWEKALKRSHQLQGSWEKLLGLGCKAGTLVDLVIPCVCADWESSHRQQDLDQLKRRSDSIIKRLESLASDAETLGAMRLRHLDGASLAFSLALPMVLGTSLRIDPPADFFLTWPADLRACAARLENLRTTLVEGWSVRQSGGALNTFILYRYCREVTGGKASYADLANVLNAGLHANGSATTVGEDGLRMQLRRLEREHTEPLIRQIESLMKKYVSSSSESDLSFMRWVLTRNLPQNVKGSASEPGVYELLADASRQRERSLQIRRGGA